MVDGVAGKTYTSIPRVVLTEAGIKQQIKFSSDGRRVAYVAGRAAKNFWLSLTVKKGLSMTASAWVHHVSVPTAAASRTLQSVAGKRLPWWME